METHQKKYLKMLFEYKYLANIHLWVLLFGTLKLKMPACFESRDLGDLGVVGTCGGLPRIEAASEYEEAEELNDLCDEMDGDVYWWLLAGDLLFVCVFWQLLLLLSEEVERTLEEVEQADGDVLLAVPFSCASSLLVLVTSSSLANMSSSP